MKESKRLPLTKNAIARRLHNFKKIQLEGNVNIYASNKLDIDELVELVNKKRNE